MDNEDYLFDNYFDDINLNEELVSFYEFINDEKLTNDFAEQSKLIDFRNENFKRYSDINLSILESLPSKFNSIINEIKKIYSFINTSEILVEEDLNAKETRKILDLLESYFNLLNISIEEDLKTLESENNKRQNELKSIDYSFMDEKSLSLFFSKYKAIVLFNATIDDNIYDNYKRQIKRKKYLNELYRIINIEMDNKDEDMISSLNNKINKELNKIHNFIIYLEDLIKKNSIYKNEFETFKEYYNTLIAYNDNDCNDVYRIYNLLFNDNKLRSLLMYFEKNFINELEKEKKEETFIFEKYGEKNIKKTIDYISANYINFISNDEKNLVNDLYKNINSDEFKIEQVYYRLKLLTNNIWKKTITDIYSYSSDNDFSFICTNKEFVDEKHQAILITKKMLERVTDYHNYQIGFICDYNDNLLYITENDDIMTVDYNDMSNLKTPKQIEQEFINFKVCNRIALNGYLTKLSAVYYIDDGDFIKYKKAVQLSNQYKLPLILLKKDKI